MSSQAALTPADFEYVQNLVFKGSAVILESGKEYLVESRLSYMVHREGCGSVHDLIQKVKTQSLNCIHQEIVEALLTCETSFFRDIHPFEALGAHVLPDLVKKRETERRINIWSAAAATGQEAYSTALTLREKFNLAGWSVNILATDLSMNCLNRLQGGKYNQLEINRGLPAPLMLKYFRRSVNEWTIDESVRRMVSSRQMNLAGTWPSLPPMDIVFLRNVMIYFNIETRKQILAKVRGVMRPDGYLFLGASETAYGLDDNYERFEVGRSTCFRLRPR